MATLLYRLGHFATRRRWAVLLVWLALLVGVGAAAVAFSGTMTSSFTIPGTPAPRVHPSVPCDRVHGPGGPRSNHSDAGDRE